MELKTIIQKTGFRFNKRYGQNFISDDHLLSEIVDAAEIHDSDVVVEIGAGGGTLTRIIASRAGAVYSYEIDKSLKPVLQETLSGVDNATVIFRDFMREPCEDLRQMVRGNFTVIANLPYYITSPVTMRLLEEFPECKKIVIMVQKEVAARYTAVPGTKDYGAITAAINFYGDAEYMFTVLRDSFYPVPEVDSAVIKITRNLKYSVKSEEAFRKTVRTGFLSRRKILVNNLMLTFNIPREKSESYIRAIGKDLSVRGEALSAADFAALSDLLFADGLLS